MGHSSTPTFRTEYKVKSGYGCITPSAWNTKQAGRPSDTNLSKNMDLWKESFTNGANKHVYNGQFPIVSAKVVRQSNDEVVATWEAK
jgi:hypothetical protein